MYESMSAQFRRRPIMHRQIRAKEREFMKDFTYTLGIDIGSTTVKIAVLDAGNNLLFADYERHFANIQETLSSLLEKAKEKLGELTVHPVITGSGGLTLANHLEIPFVQEVIAVSTSLQTFAQFERHVILRGKGLQGGG